MITLDQLINSHRPVRKIQRVGRGPGSKRGKTCCRGSKGDKARSGYKRHFGHEGGQMPLYRKLPCRGFSNERFRPHIYEINLKRIDALYQQGEVVNLETLSQKQCIPKHFKGSIKILGTGELTKNVSFEVHAFSQSAREKLDRMSASCKTIR